MDLSSSMEDIFQNNSELENTFWRLQYDFYKQKSLNNMYLGIKMIRDDERKLHCCQNTIQYLTAFILMVE